MRVGMNPLREVQILEPIPPRLPVVAVTTHLPDTTSDYHRDRWEIVTASLTLARKHAGMEHHFVVWDNGSCPELREWLFYQFKPDVLIFSQNIGVAGSMFRLFGAYQDCIIAYANDDILYYPNWLPEQIKILKHYPNVGTVSGCVTRFYSGKADSETMKWALLANVRITKWTPPFEWDFQHAASIGARSEIMAAYKYSYIPLLEYNGVRAGVGGNHCQFVTYASRLLPFLQSTNKYMDKLFEGLDKRINEARLLRLLTTTRRTRHIGNRLNDAERKEIHELLEK